MCAPVACYADPYLPFYPVCAPVACFADLHVRVKKLKGVDLKGGREGEGRITTVFEPLVGNNERVEELAAMLGELRSLQPCSVAFLRLLNVTLHGWPLKQPC